MPSLPPDLALLGGGHSTQSPEVAAIFIALAIGLTILRVRMRGRGRGPWGRGPRGGGPRGGGGGWGGPPDDANTQWDIRKSSDTAKDAPGSGEEHNSPSDL